MKNIVAVISTTLLISSCSWFSSPPTRVENPIVTGINYVGLAVSDLDQSEKLYHQSAGMQPELDGLISDDPVVDTLTNRRGVSAKTRLLRGVNAQVLMMQFESPSQAAKQAPLVDVNGPGIAHLAFQVVNTTQTYQKFLAGGATHVGALEMFENPRSHVSYAYVRDTDNTLVEIEHVNVAALELPAPPKNERRIRQISIATTDMDRIVAFYSMLLETENPRRLGSLIKLSGEMVDDVSGIPGAEIEMAWFQLRNLELEIIQYHQPITQPLSEPRPFDALGYNMIVFDVTDLAAAREKLLAAGGAIVLDAQPMQGGHIFFARDLDGNLIGFQTLPARSPYSSKNFKDNGLG